MMNLWRRCCSVLVGLLYIFFIMLYGRNCLRKIWNLACILKGCHLKSNIHSPNIDSEATFYSIFDLWLTSGVWLQLDKRYPIVLAHAKPHRAQPPMLHSTGNKSGRCDGTSTIDSKKWRPAMATNEILDSVRHPFPKSDAVWFSWLVVRSSQTPAPNIDSKQT